jgi:hypothetical protein
MRYTPSALLKAVKDPSLIHYEAERVLSKMLFRRKYGSGASVMDKDWDNLILLDAMRTDYFREQNTIEGDYDEVVSLGSTSKEFIDANFVGENLHDTIYVTANPYAERLSGSEFFRVHYTELFEKWDPDLKTIPPGAVADATIEMHEKYPDKRIVSHFMQPHAPYIGPTGRELYDGQSFGVFNPKLRERGSYDVPSENIPTAVEKGIISEDTLRMVYEENVEIAIESAKELVSDLDGRTVISADHGEMLGDKILWNKRYGHGAHMYAPELRIVPWHVINTDDRRDVVSGEPEAFETLEESVRESRLGALGYVE